MLVGDDWLDTVSESMNIILENKNDNWFELTYASSIADCEEEEEVLLPDPELLR